MIDKMFSVAALIVYLAIIATIFTSPLTRGIIEAIGNAFTNSIRVAKA